MSATNDPQLVSSEETKEVNKGKRPFWVSLAAIVLLLFGVIGGCTRVQYIFKIGSIDWAYAARTLDADIPVAKLMVYSQAYGGLAFAIFIIALCVGMWSMKKWGAVLVIIMAVLGLASLIGAPLIAKMAGMPLLTTSPTVIVFYGLFALIGVGEIFLWRKGRLS
jgi:hypothetical protein